jgi:hypothetical protein
MAKAKANANSNQNNAKKMNEANIISLQACI